MSNPINKDEQEQKALIRQQSMQDFLANSVAKKKGIGGHVRDLGLTALSGAVSIPELAVGLADIPTGGSVGKFLENKDGALGFRPREAKEAIASWKTEKSQKQLQEFTDTEGFGSKVGYALDNPSLVTNTVVESLPSMFAGGIIGRGLGAVAKGLSPVAAGALGEGAVGAGMQAESIRQQTDDGLLTAKQAGLSAATGATTAGFGFAGGKIAQKLGIGDVDTIVAGGGRTANPAADIAGSAAANAAKNKGILRRGAEGALSEGVLEELPQSVSETILQNEALGRPLDEGVSDAAALGLLSGAAMGAGAGAFARNRRPDERLTPTEDMGQEDARYDPTNPLDPSFSPAGLIGNESAPQLGFQGRATNQFNAGPDGEVFTGDQYNEYLAQQQERARTERDANQPQSRNFDDVTQTPQGYDQFGNDPRLPAPDGTDFTASQDGQVYGRDDINTRLSQERDAAAERRARIARGEILDVTPVPQAPKPSELMGLDPNKGSLSAAAAIAVDTGASSVAADFEQASAQSSEDSATRMAGLVEVETQEQPTGSKWLQSMRTSLATADIDNGTYQALSQSIEADPKSVPERARLKKAIDALPKKPEPTAKKIDPKARVIDEAKAQSVAYNPRGDKIPLQFDVVDASELLSSHSNNFVENPDYPQQYQPRDRADAGYQAQVLDIVKKFNPELLGKDNSVNAGSPIVGRDDNLVESGNGRTIAIRRMYESGKGDAYRQFVNKSAEEFGLDANAINQMQQPVLVRRNNSDMDREQFALRANAPTGAAMSSSERAKADAKILPNADLLELDGNGSLNLKGSYKFTQAFISSLDKNEVNELVLSNGELSQTGQNRVSGALLQNAYGSSKLTKAVTEDIDSSAKNVLKTLVDKAPQITKINQSIKEGNREADTLSEDIKTAAETYIDLVESGANIDDYLNMEDMFGEGISPQSKEIVRDFYSNARSATRMGSRLQARIDATNRVNAPDLLADFEADAPNVLSNDPAPTNAQTATQLTDENPTVNIPAPKKAPRELSDRAMVREMQKPTTNNGEVDYKSKLNLSEGQNLGRLIMSSGRVFDDAVVKSMDDKGVTVEAVVNGKRGLHKGMNYQTVDAGINNTKSYAKQQVAKKKSAQPRVAKPKKDAAVEQEINPPKTYAQVQTEVANEMGITTNEDGEYDISDAQFDTMEGRVRERMEVQESQAQPQSNVSETETKKTTTKTAPKPDDKPIPTGDWQTQVNGNNFRFNEDGITISKDDRVVHIRGANSITASKKAKSLVDEEIRDLHYIAAKEDANDSLSEGSIWLDGNGNMIRKKGTKKPKGALASVLKQTIAVPKQKAKASTTKNSEPKFSRVNTKGATNTTRQQVISKLSDKFGKETIAKLMADGKLDIKVLSDFVKNGRLTIPSDVDGLYLNGKATLIADNLSDDMIIPTFLHELGGHGGMQTLMDKKAYAALMRDFDALVKAGDPMAMQAKAMADSVARNKQDALDEYLPYLITLASRAKAKQGKIAGMINRMVMAIRSWLRNTLGASIKVNSQDILSLAERMVNEVEKQNSVFDAMDAVPQFSDPKNPDIRFSDTNVPAKQIDDVRAKFEGTKDWLKAPNGQPTNLNEQQWLQVRTPAFKQWFGDWQDDPVNASKILDDNKEPLVMYHGSSQDFWSFDMSKADLNRNSQMQGSFFSDSAEVASAYTVRPLKDKKWQEINKKQEQARDDFFAEVVKYKQEGNSFQEARELAKAAKSKYDKLSDQRKSIERALFDDAESNAINKTMAVFINSRAPFEQDVKGGNFREANSRAFEMYDTGIYDGVVNDNVDDSANLYSESQTSKVVISFDPTNIKSATANAGTFDGSNPDIRFSRAAGMDDQFDPRNIARESMTRFYDWASSNPPGKLSWWHKTIGTMYNLAQRNPYFKPVFDNTEKFINDVSYYASKASEFAPRLLPQLDSLRDITKSAIGAKDNEALSKPIFEGTLLWGRDLDGKAVLIKDWRKKVMATSKQDRLQMLKDANRITPAQLQQLATLNNIQANRFINGIIDEEVNAGLVWTDNELRSKFNLDDKQIELYREFRATTDNSLDSMTRSDMLRRLGKDATAIETAVMEAGTLREAVFTIEQHINGLIQASPKKEKSLKNTLKDIKESQFRTNKLIDDGYAPLSRFGQYTVDVVDKDGNREYFGMFESAYEARKMKGEMDALYGDDQDFTVTQGALSKEEFKLFAGVTPETAELFGEMMGLDATGDKAADDAFQEYLRRTKNNRSTMKRLMHRKGIKGYSEDVGRVLASFVYSNARHTSAALNMGNLDRSIADIPKGEGQLKDAAVKLAQYIKNPQEEGQVIRGWMFAQYLGGSVASAVVNLTQPIAVSFPYLSQFGGAVKAAAQLSKSSSDWGKSLKNKNNNHFETDLREAIERAEADGTLSPQEVHNLMKMASGKNPLRAGDGTKIGNAKALAGNSLSRVSLAWGSLFSLAEQVNRRVTFVAAYRMAKEQGMDNPAEFATNSIKETQFVYNKASRMNWGRGAVGGTLMTFKTYTVSYMELMHRLWTQGEKGSVERDQGRKAVGIMIGTLFLLGGAGGLPFMEDAEDLVDGIGQIMGYNFSSKKVRQQFLDEWVGEMAGDFIDGGISSVSGSPTDVSGRLGLGNLIPGTGIFKERTSNSRDVLEIVGPAGDFVGRVATGTRDIAKGVANLDSTSLKKGALEFAPTAVRNAVKGTSMATSGIYKDTKGYKVADVSPVDAAFKFFGFQPRDISKIQEANYLGQSSTSYYNLRASSIRALWAAGVVEGNQSKVDDARDAVKDWNKKNPNQKIIIKPNDIARRVREMKMDKVDRVIKLAPKSGRGTLAQELNGVRDGM